MEWMDQYFNIEALMRNYLLRGYPMETAHLREIWATAYDAVSEQQDQYIGVPRNLQAQGYTRMGAPGTFRFRRFEDGSSDYSSLFLDDKQFFIEQQLHEMTWAGRVFEMRHGSIDG